MGNRRVSTRHDYTEPDSRDASGTWIARSPRRHSRGRGAGRPVGDRSPGVRGVRLRRCARDGATGGLPEGAAGAGGVGPVGASGAGAPCSGAVAAPSGIARGGGRGGSGGGGRCGGVGAGTGRGRPAPPAMEHLASLRASARDGDVRRLPDTVSGRLRARGAGGDRVFGVGAASARARRVDGVGRRAATGSFASGGVPEPVFDSARRAVPQPGQSCSGPGAAPAGGGLRVPLPLSPVAGRDVRRGGPGRGEFQGGQFPVRGAHGGARPPGPEEGAEAVGQIGVPVRVGRRLARAAGRWVRGCGAVAGARRGAGRRCVGGARVWRSGIGRQAFVDPPGEERGAAGVRSGPGGHRQPGARPSGGEGLLSVHRPCGGLGGHAGGHSGAAPGAHRRADARPGHGAVHPGRDGPQLRDAPELRGPGHYRAQPDRGGDPGSASASDLGGELRGSAPGGAALRFRRAARRRGERRRGRCRWQDAAVAGRPGRHRRGRRRIEPQDAGGWRHGPGGGLLRVVRPAAPT